MSAWMPEVPFSMLRATVKLNYNSCGSFTARILWSVLSVCWVWSITVHCCSSVLDTGSSFAFSLRFRLCWSAWELGIRGRLMRPQCPGGPQKQCFRISSLGEKTHQRFLRNRVSCTCATWLRDDIILVFDNASDETWAWPQYL